MIILSRSLRFAAMGPLVFWRALSDSSEKIKSFAHGEFNKEHLVDEKNIARKIQMGSDVFERGYKIKRVDIDDSFPEYIINNQDFLKAWIA